MFSTNFNPVWGSAISEFPIGQVPFDSSYTFAVTVFESTRYWHKTCIVKFSLINASFMSASKITIEGKEGKKKLIFHHICDREYSSLNPPSYS